VCQDRLFEVEGAPEGVLGGAALQARTKPASFFNWVIMYSSNYIRQLDAMYGVLYKTSVV